ncbi:MAG: hypothetical protein RSB59_04920 [Clostridia bacterium]
MKAVIRSCKPYWFYLIIQGVKIIEVGKTAPTAIDWDKTVYMYCSKDKKSFNKIPEEDRKWFSLFLGKVVCEFHCGGMMCSEALFMPCNIKYHCIQTDELYKYSNGKSLYGWKISKLKIYDEPKEVGKFFIFEREIGSGWLTDYCEYRNYLTKPPQSWQYCEELEENKNE